MKKVAGIKAMDNATKRRLEVLADMPDSEIDTSEIPEWTKDNFASAVPFYSLYKPRKEQITARIDADVLAWLKSFGKGYQTLMNDLLRKEMLESQDKSGQGMVTTKR